MNGAVTRIQDGELSKDGSVTGQASRGSREHRTQGSKGATLAGFGGSRPFPGTSNCTWRGEAIAKVYWLILIN